MQFIHLRSSNDDEAQYNYDLPAAVDKNSLIFFQAFASFCILKNNTQ